MAECSPVDSVLVLPVRKFLSGDANRESGQRPRTTHNEARREVVVCCMREQSAPVQLKEEDVTRDRLARPSSELVVEGCVRTESWRYLTGYYNDALDNRKW